MKLVLGLKLKIKYWLAQLRSRVIGSYAKAILTEGYNGTLLVAADDFSIGRQLAFRGEYNVSQLARLTQLIGPDTRVLIVGTHVGTILVPLAKIARHVTGIEANPRTFELLRKNIYLNSLANVRVLSLAAADKNGEIEFQMSATNSGGSKIRPRSDKSEFSYDRPERVTVSAVRLDDFLRGETFDLVLVDIEGSEYFALQGMQEILSKAEHLVIEILPNHIENVAGTTLEKFMTVIPGAFEYAEYLCADPGQVLSRSELRARMESTWKSIYFGGVDLLFGRNAPSRPPIGVKGSQNAGVPYDMTS